MWSDDGRWWCDQIRFTTYFSRKKIYPPKASSALADTWHNNNDKHRCRWECNSPFHEWRRMHTTEKKGHDIIHYCEPAFFGERRSSLCETLQCCTINIALQHTSPLAVCGLFCWGREIQSERRVIVLNSSTACLCMHVSERAEYFFARTKKSWVFTSPITTFFLSSSSSWKVQRTGLELDVCFVIA